MPVNDHTPDGGPLIITDEDGDHVSFYAAGVPRSESPRHLFAGHHMGGKPIIVNLSDDDAAALLRWLIHEGVS